MGVNGGLVSLVDDEYNLGRGDRILGLECELQCKDFVLTQFQIIFIKSLCGPIR